MSSMGDEEVREAAGKRISRKISSLLEFSCN